MTVQPEPCEQSAPETVQPVEVCMAIWFEDMRLTASRTSISPPAGQLGPLVQKLGQTCGYQKFTNARK